MSIELKPCPFCGKQGYIMKTNGGYAAGCNTVECCAFAGFYSSQESEDESAVSWNTRSPETGQPDETTNEDRMVTLERDENGKPTVWCDPEIAPVVKYLNDNGVKTVASCSGHGHIPATICLKDGRCIIIAKDLEEMNRMIDVFGVDIGGNPKRESRYRHKADSVWHINLKQDLEYFKSLPQKSDLTLRVIDFLEYALSEIEDEGSNANT